MKTKMIKNPNLIGVLVGITGVVLVMALFQLPMDAWLTPDQQGDRLFANEDYAAAVEKYESPVRKGIADYRDGNFEDAAGYFGRVDDAQSAYNRGNSLIMLGKYDDAIASFERALQFAPDWRNARGNRDLAIARRDKMKPPDDDAGGTGGELEADEIVFDDRAKNSSQTEEIEAGAGEQMSDEGLRELWLQRVQTRPGDFLRVKFSYQLSRQEAGEEE